MGSLYQNICKWLSKYMRFKPRGKKIPEENEHKNFLWLLGGFQLSPLTWVALGLTTFTTCTGLTFNEHLSGGVLQVQILVEI